MHDAQAALDAAEAEAARGAASPRLRTSRWKTTACTCRSSPQDCGKAEAEAARALAGVAERRGKRRSELANRASAMMTPSAGSTRPRPPSSTPVLPRRQASGSCTPGSPTMTCPGFSSSSRTTSTQNTIRDIATFQSRLNREADLIKERIATINASLVDIDYNPGRYIRLEPEPTPEH